jgi:GntR family transcriptional regulator
MRLCSLGDGFGEGARLRHSSVSGQKKPSRHGVINRDAAIPLYHQIYLTLRDEITSGKRGFGAAMPTEMQLGARYSVSRITARRALDELANGGFVERRRRTGTTVIYRQPDQQIEANIDQAVESLIAFGQKTAVKVVEVAEEEADETIAAKLGLEPGERVIRAVRLRSAKGQPLGLIVSHIPASLGIDVTPERLTATPMLALLRDAGVVIGGAVQTIEAVVADLQLATALAIEPRAAVLHIERQVEDAQKNTVLVTSAYYRADRYRITLDMHQHSEFSPTYG